MISESQQRYARATLGRQCYRTRSEGLLGECTRPGARQSPGCNGSEKVYAAFGCGKLLLWRPYKTWNAAEASRCTRALKKRLVEDFGPDRAFQLVRDNDGSGFMSLENQATETACGIHVHNQPPRTPEASIVELLWWYNLALENLRELVYIVLYREQ